MRTRGWRIAVVLAGFGLMCFVVWNGLQKKDTHDEMIALLDHVEQRTPMENPYLGVADLAEVDGQLRRMPRGATPPPPLLFRRGMNLLQIGETDAAVEAFEAIEQMLPAARERAPAEIFDELSAVFSNQPIRFRTNGFLVTQTAGIGQVVQSLIRRAAGQKIAESRGNRVIVKLARCFGQIQKPRRAKNRTITTAYALKASAKNRRFFPAFKHFKKILFH